MLVSIAFSSGSSVDSGGVAAAEDALVCSVDSGCGWRGVSCTWPAAMVLKAVVLADVSEEAMDRMCSESLAVVCLGIGGGGSRGGRGGRGGGGGNGISGCGSGCGGHGGGGGGGGKCDCEWW